MYMFVSLLRVKNYGKDTKFEMRKTAKFVWYNLLVFGQISCFFTRDLLVFQILEWHVWKSKYIDWTHGLECDHWVWPWPWPWPWIFKVKHGICYISTKNGPIATKRKANISIELRPQMQPLGLTLAVTLTLNFQGQIWNLLYLNQKWSEGQV